MKLEDIKNQIESKNITNTFLIFRCDNTFIPRQYSENISSILNLPIEYIEDILSIDSNNDIFNVNSNNSLRIFNTEIFDNRNDSLLNKSNLIVICNKIEENTQQIYNNYIIEVGNIPFWCVKDYTYSKLKGIEPTLLDWLIDNCNCNIDRIQMEIDKLSLFDKKEKVSIFKCMLAENAFEDITNKTIFDYTNAIVNRNKSKLNDIYEDINNMDVEPLGVVTILYKNFMNLIKVRLTNNPTPENTGLNSKQIYAINKLPRIWSKDELINIIKFIDGIDYKIKSGDMPMEYLRDYVMIKIMSGC